MKLDIKKVKCTKSEKNAINVEKNQRSCIFTMDGIETKQRVKRAVRVASVTSQQAVQLRSSECNEQRSVTSQQA